MKGWWTCPYCGALTNKPRKHRRWHLRIQKNRAKPGPPGPMGPMGPQGEPYYSSLSQPSQQTGSDPSGDAALSHRETGDEQ